MLFRSNITDVDDRINQASIDLGVPIAAITDKFTAIYHQDMAILGALPQTLEPRATGHIAEMLAIIGRLIEAGLMGITPSDPLIVGGLALMLVLAALAAGYLPARRAASLDPMIALRSD